MTEPSSSSHFSLVLPGAIARGAYEAGVIEVLVEEDLKIDRIVATSSGALNGLALAAGIRSGRKREMVEALAQSWIVHGRWQAALSISPWAFLRGRGLSTKDALIGLMRDLVKPCRSSHRHDIQLRLILAPLNGVKGNIGEREATTYEKVVKFANEDFDSQDSLERVFEAVAAACAFPGLFEPVEVDDLGACIDGGAVNNAPIKYALEASSVSRVLMPVAFPRVMEPGDWKKGLSLFNRLIEILINERLYRDLKEAATINQDNEKLEALCRAGHLTPKQLALVKEAMNIRKIEITEIRPHGALDESPFTGFFRRSGREDLIETGRQAAREALRRLPEFGRRR